MLGIITKAQIEHVLHSQIIGRIGCCVDNEMYIVPVTYVLNKEFIYAHSKEGLKIRMMRKNPHVCFQVDSIDNMTNWRSVILWGEFQELKGEKAQVAGMKIIEDRLLPYMISGAVQPSHRASETEAIIEKGYKPVVFRIKITKSSGRYEKNAPVETNGNYHLTTNHTKHDT